MLMSRSFKVAKKDNYLRLFQCETRSLLFALSFSFLFFFCGSSMNSPYFEKRRVRVFAIVYFADDATTKLDCMRVERERRSWRQNRRSSVPTVPSSLIFSSSREVFLRFEETVSGFPQHLRALRKIRGQNAVARVCDGERPRSSFSPRSSPLSPSYILYFRKTASALLGRASHSRIYDYETCF